MQLLNNCYADVTVNYISDSSSTLGAVIGSLEINISYDASYMPSEVTINAIGGILNISAIDYIGTIGLFASLSIYGNNTNSISFSNLFSEINLAGPKIADYSSIGPIAGSGWIGDSTQITFDKLWCSLAGTPANQEITQGVFFGFETYVTAPYTITNAYQDVTKRPSIANYPISGASYLSTAAMHKEETYTGWDFIELWYIDENFDYPRFAFANTSVIKAMLILFETYPEYINIDDTNQEIRAGSMRNYRVIDMTDDNQSVDVTARSTISFLPIEDIEAEQEDYMTDNTIDKTLSVYDVGKFKTRFKFRGKEFIQNIEAYGPDRFEVSENVREPFRRGLPKKVKAIAVYKDGFEEHLTDNTMYWFPLNKFNPDNPDEEIESKIVVTETSLKITELGKWPIALIRFGLIETFELTTLDPELPDILDVLNTSATLYVFFRMGYDMDVDTYFMLRAYDDEAKTNEITTLNTIDNTDNFSISIDGRASWQLIPQSALSPSGEESEVYCCKMYVGPLDKVFIDLGVATGEETGDIYAPLITVTPPPGNYQEPVQVKISINEPGDIFFGFNDQDATIPYNPEAHITISKKVTLHVKAIDVHGNASRKVSYLYNIDNEAPIVSFYPEQGAYLEPIYIELSANEMEATVYFTTDGSEPSQTSEIYTMPIYLDQGNLTIKARAIDAAGNVGVVSTAEYTIVGHIAGGSFSDPIIIASEDNVQTAYTMDMIDDVYFRYDNFIPEVDYIAQFVDLPEEYGAGIVVFDANENFIASGWIMQPLTFTATTESMFIMAARGSTHWDPVKLVIRKA